MQRFAEVSICGIIGTGRACSSAGRAHGLQPWGQGFEPPQVHQTYQAVKCDFWFLIHSDVGVFEGGHSPWAVLSGLYPFPDKVVEASFALSQRVMVFCNSPNAVFCGLTVINQ